MLKKITLKALSNLYWDDVSGGCQHCVWSESKVTAPPSPDPWSQPEPRSDWQQPKPDIYIQPLPYKPDPYPYIG